MKNTNTLLAIFLLLIAFTGCSQNEDIGKDSRIVEESNVESGTTAADGEKDAENDIQQGKLQIWTMPLPSPPWAAQHSQLCKAKGITLKSTKTVEEFKSPYYVAYNKRVTEELDKKFGPGIIQKLETQARNGK